MTLEEENARLREENAQLRAENAALKEMIKVLTARINELEKRLGEKKKASPPSFVKANKPKRKTKKKRKKRADKDNNGRRREEPTRIEKHQLVKCPECDGELNRHKEWYRRQIIDIPEPQPIEVVEHRIHQSWCESCQKWHRPEVSWPEAVGQGRMGVRLMGLIGYMRAILRLPYRQIQALLATIYRFSLSIGELVNLSRKVEQKLDAEVDALKEKARGSPLIHMDETGWREDGQNGYIWCMVTDTPQPIRYFEYHQSRSGDVAMKMLGEAFDGVLSSDFYAAYNKYRGKHQRCWVHLLRDLSDLRDTHAKDTSVVVWCLGIKQLYQQAQQWAQVAATDAQRQTYVVRLIEMARQFGLMYAQIEHPCRTLCKRLLRHMDELFTFVLDPELSADNNLAERALRPLVIQRKVSGGSRSEKGSKTCMRLASLFQTWSAQGLNPLHECWRLLGYQPI